jgi:hypothetical protein
MSPLRQVLRIKISVVMLPRCANSASTFPNGGMPRFSSPQQLPGFYSNFILVIREFYLTYYSDIAFYGVSLNQSVILSDIGFGGGKTQFDSLHNIAVGNIIVALAVSRSFMFIPSSAKVYC